MSAPHRAGVTVFLTGLSGAGKSTIADALVAGLEADGRPVTVLDGDVVRTHLSSELSFSRQHRDLNIRRIGFVAGEVVKHGGTVVVAAIAPYEAAREEARALVEQHGRFVLVHLATPLEVCEARDVKGLYAKARAGEIREFTGVSDPYEPPARAEVTIDTSVTPLSESVALIRTAMDSRPAPMT
jgi:adenylyl-sulfate kinase